MSVVDLIRPEIRDLRPYHSARFANGLVRLNANETPWPPPGDMSESGLNRYPEPHPEQLRERLARFYGVAAERLLVTRGSSDAIDLLIRGFCRAGEDEIVLCPPTFGMYEVYAQIQGARIRHIPLVRDAGFALDLDAIERQWSKATKMIFVCSPNNPTGNRIDDDQLTGLAQIAEGRGLVVIDAAYAEFADHDPTLTLLDRFEHVAILRTLSKAAGLAAIRCGAALCAPEVVELLSRIQPPFCFPRPSQDAALNCLTPPSQQEIGQRVGVIRNERERLAAALAARDDIRQVWPSEANFLLVEAVDPRAFVAAAAAGGILVRDFSHEPALENGIRITVGSPAQNEQLLQALS